MPQGVLTGGQSGTLRRGLRDAFASTYDTEAEQTKLELEPLMALGLPSDTDQEFYAYFKHAPYPRYWPRGRNVMKAGFEAVQFSVVNRDFGLEVEWHKNDEEDNQLAKGVRDRASDTGRNFAYSHTRAFYDLLLGTTNYLPAVPNAPDGAAVFATTAGGVARFGAADGNLLTGTGVATAAAIRTDIFNAMEQFGLFQNTEGYPLWPRTVLDQGYIVIAGQSNEQIFSEAFYQNPTAIAASSATSNAAVENIFKSAGKNVELRFTQHITTDDYFIFMRGAPQKVFFEQTRQPPQEEVFDERNSKESARSLLRSMIWHSRSGYGVFLPYQTIKINN